MRTMQDEIFLRVENPRLLEQGSLPRFSPSPRGATIGSGHADWRLYDATGSVAEIHAAVQIIDGRYSLVDLCGKTFINHHREPLGQNQIVALNDGDRIGIGKYQIGVHIGEAQDLTHLGATHLREVELDQLLGQPQQEQEIPVVSLLSDAEHIDPGENDRQLLASFTSPQEKRLDPLLHLDDPQAQTAGQDFIANPKTVSVPVHTTSQDLAGTLRESLSPYQPHAGEPPMSQQHPIPPTSASPEQGSPKVDHIVSAPLFNSLGLQLEQLDTEQAHHLIDEIGSALKAAINGLLTLYQADKQQPVNLSLLGRSYQLIEDNPLRLGSDYPDTVQALFSKHKSQVYLSAPHAIEESIDALRRNQAALLKATQEGLQHVLDAFNPVALEQRFGRYQKNRDNGVDADAWAWQMYRHYYQELASSRQYGLEKLFWEVFEQAYDREMRTPSGEQPA